MKETAERTERILTAGNDGSMKAGKLSGTVLGRSVLKQLHTKRDEVLAGPAAGQDNAVFQAKGEVVCAMASMPAAAGLLVPVTVYTACNSVACGGAQPLGILVSLLLPTASDEQRLRDMMCGVEAICVAEHMQVLGGHTEVTRTVTEPVLSVTAFGTRPAGAVCGEARPGMDILVTGRIGTAGAAVLAKERQEDLRSRYTQPFLDRAVLPEKALSVRCEAAAATEAGAAMHDISEGGIYGALWELGQRFHVGLEVDLKQIPIRQETVEICEFFQLNPYKLLSTGSLLIAAEDGNALAAEIRRAGYDATVIGRITEGNERVLLCEEERRFLETAQTDELYKIIRS
ncbi:MAG: AIR synthase-related protein [Muribaculaceae bacterium]|nr:AIR synthase-related protein [Roseburia sp.]MCM1431621.1 AIR synthase-related protein [Muribaculaceae bacterium]MCM1492086.1 AIR synthase-related protein [Muribaculaceae bacterium]